MAKIIKQYTRHVLAARAALCKAGDKDGFDHILDVDNMPEVITGYDPTYILQFGFVPEQDYMESPRQLTTLEELKQ